MTHRTSQPGDDTQTDIQRKTSNIPLEGIRQNKDKNNKHILIMIKLSDQK